MKKILVNSIIITSLVLPLIAAAQQPSPPPVLDICCGPNSVLQRIINWMFAILLIVAAIFIIIAAYYFITAAGDTDKVKTARNFVLYALIGVLVAFAAKGLVKLVEIMVT